MEIEGKILLIKPTGTFGDKGFRKRELVVTTNEQYPQEIPVEFTQNNCDILDAYKVGDHVKISVNARGNSWLKDGLPEADRRWFLSFNGWRIEKVNATQINQAPPTEEPDLPWD